MVGAHVGQNSPESLFGVESISLLRIYSFNFFFSLFFFFLPFFPKKIVLLLIKPNLCFNKTGFYKFLYHFQKSSKVCILSEVFMIFFPQIGKQTFADYLFIFLINLLLLEVYPPWKEK